MRTHMQIRIEHLKERPFSPLSRFVHTGLDGPFWKAAQFEPPMPPRDIGSGGYPVWIVAHRGRELAFASPEEIAHAIDVLGQRVLPSPRQLGLAQSAVNSHWLSRLHASWKPWKIRQELVKKLSPYVKAR
jgi:hypothetical protein